MSALTFLGAMEEWRPVLGWEGIYEVSSHGRVRSLERVVPARWGTMRLRARNLRPRVTRQGYGMVALQVKGVRLDVGIHALVAEAFYGPRPEGMDVCHGNDVKLDNRVENLRFGTRSENLRDAVRNGINPNSNRTHCANGHEFTPENTAMQEVAGRVPYRRCRTCGRIRAREIRAKRAA